MARSWASVAALVLGLSLLLGCGPGAASKPARASKGVLLIRCVLDNAEVWLDNRYLREVAELKGGVRLGPGVHRLEVRHVDYHSMYYEVELAPGERKALDVSLARRLP